MTSIPHIAVSKHKPTVKHYDYGLLVFDNKELAYVQSGEANSQSKLTAEQVKFIRGSHQTSTILGRRFGISSAQVRNIKLGKTWKHL